MAVRLWGGGGYNLAIALLRATQALKAPGQARPQASSSLWGLQAGFSFRKRDSLGVGRSIQPVVKCQRPFGVQLDLLREAHRLPAL